MKSFLIKLFIFSLSIAVILFITIQMLPDEYKRVEYWFVLLFFIFSTAIIQNIFLKAEKQSPATFIRAFMAVTGLKFFLYLLLIIVYLLLAKKGALPVVLCFLLMYLAFMTFEVVHLLKFFRQKQNSDSKKDS